MIRTLKLIIQVVAALVLLATTVSAIPAFARKYDMSCTTCHSPFPKIKPFGDEFARNGFVLVGQEPARYFRETGDDMLLLMRDFPLSIKFEAYGRWRPQSSGRTDLQSPYNIKLLSGGQIAKDISYYFYFFLGERGEVAGLEDAFVMFNNLFGSQLDVYVGQFQVSDPLFKRELRLSFENYDAYGMKPGLSGIDMTYDRGVMFTYELASGTDLALEILNGNGIGAADADENFDDNVFKNAMFRVSQEIGEHVRIGGFVYAGSEESGGVQNDVRMGGPDVTISLEPLELNVQMVRRLDDHPFFLAQKREITSDGGFAELIYSPQGDKSRWYAVGLVNYITSDIAGEEQRSASVTGIYMLGRNVRLMAEYAYDFEFKANKLTTGIICAF